MQNITSRIFSSCATGSCTNLTQLPCFYMQAQKKNLEVDSETALSEEEGEKAAEEVAECLKGSLSSQYGGDTSTLYHQCDVHTKEQKLNQIILLKVISSEICLTAVTLSHLLVFTAVTATVGFWTY